MKHFLKGHFDRGKDYLDSNMALGFFQPGLPLSLYPAWEKSFSFFVSLAQLCKGFALT